MSDTRPEPVDLPKLTGLARRVDEAVCVECSSEDVGEEGTAYRKPGRMPSAANEIHYPMHGMRVTDFLKRYMSGARLLEPHQTLLKCGLVHEIKDFDDDVRFPACELSPRPCSWLGVLSDQQSARPVV